MTQRALKQQARQRCLRSLLSCTQAIALTLFCIWAVRHRGGDLPWYIESLLHAIVTFNVLLCMNLIHNVWRWWVTPCTCRATDHSYREPHT